MAEMNPQFGNGNQILMVDKDNSPHYVNEGDFDSAKSSGLTPATVFVDPQTRRQLFVPKGQEAQAEKSGLKNYFELQGQDQASNIKQEFSPGESAALGFAKNATFGFAPQIAGAALAGEKALGGNTNFLENYRTQRDLYKDAQEEGYKQNTKSYLAGAAAPIVGSILAPAAAAKLGLGAAQAATEGAAPTLFSRIGQGAATGAGFGAVGGAGNSNADLTKGEYGKFAGDVATGAGLGAALGGGIEGTLHLGETGVHALKEAGHVLGESIEKGTAHGLGDKALLIGKTLFKGAKDLRGAEQELAGLNAQKAAQGIENSSLLSDVFSTGPNPTKNFVAQKAETALPGNLSSNTEGESLLTKILNLSPEERMAARNFNKDASAKDVISDLTDTFGNIKQNRGNIFTQGQSKAEQAYDAQNIGNVSSIIKNALADAEQGSLGSGVKGALQKAQGALDEGRALSTYNINKGPLDPTNSVDSFRRLQAARESLDPALQAARQAGDNQEAFVLGNVRKAIDEQLKSSAPKAAADQAYAEITQPLKAILKPIVDKDTGKINPYKLGSTFNDSNTGKNFRDNIQALKGVLDKYKDQMNPEQVGQITNTLDKLTNFAQVSQNQKLLQGLRQTQGPTSPAIERASAAYERAGLDTNLITKPGSTLTQADNFLVTQAKDQFGKNFSELNPQEKNKLLEMFKFNADNPTATPSAQKEGLKSIAESLGDLDTTAARVEPDVLGNATPDNSPSQATRSAARRAKASGSEGEMFYATPKILEEESNKMFGKGFADLTIAQKAKLSTVLEKVNPTPAVQAPTSKVVTVSDPFLDGKASKLFGKPYSELSPQQQNAINVLAKYQGPELTNYRGVDVSSKLNKNDVNDMFNKSQEMFGKDFNQLPMDQKQQVLNSIAPKDASYARNRLNVGMEGSPETLAKFADASQRIFNKPFAALTKEQQLTVLEKINDGSMGQIPDMGANLKQGYDNTSQSKMADDLMSYSRKPRK